MVTGTRPRVAIVLAWVCAVLLALLPHRARALPRAEPDVRIGPAPAWVEAVEIPRHKAPEQRDGQSFLLLDFQRRAVGREHVSFVRGAVRITSEVGLQEAAQRKLVFNPPHERLVVHRLEIRRGDETISHLSRKNLQVLQREPELENSVYDGTRTALAVLPDLRVDDVVVYEYSLVGANPVLDAHVMDSWQLATPMDVGTLSYRLITDRRLSVYASVGARRPDESQVGGLYHYTWRGHEVAAAVFEGDVPTEHDAVPWVQLTDFGSWREVAAWGSKLFATAAEPGPRVRAFAEEVRRQSADPERQLSTVLRRIQEEVRYFSLSFAESSHRPANPELVLARRFGDCKDKAHLMVAVLRALGFRANAALVHTSNGQQLPDLSPSAALFDHVLVVAGPVGAERWLDPTRLYQRGRASDVAPRGYFHALVLAPDQNALTPVPELADERPDVYAAMSVKIDTFGGKVGLDVKTTYTGFRAESLRALKASSSKTELNDAAGALVMKAFPRARRTSDALVVDDESTNAVSVSQTFALDDCWSTESGVHRLAIFPPWLGSRLPTAAPDRRNPLALDHPLLVVHDVELVTPWALSAKPESKHLAPGPFTFSYRAVPNGTSIRLHYELRTNARRVELAEMEGYRDSLSALGSWLEYQVTHNPALERAHAPAWLIALAVVWALLMGGLVYLVQRKRPYLPMRETPWDASLAGRRGWLMLLGLGVTLGPFRVLYAVLQALPAYSGPRWAALTTESSSEYHPHFAPLLTVELLANITLILGVSYFAYLYWARHRSFPLVFVTVQSFGLVYTVLDELVASNIPSLADQPGAKAGELTGTVIGSLLWITYVLRSRRVKATFLPSALERRRELRRERRLLRASARARRAAEAAAE